MFKGGRVSPMYEQAGKLQGQDLKFVVPTAQAWEAGVGDGSFGLGVV